MVLLKVKSGVLCVRGCRAAFLRKIASIFTGAPTTILVPIHCVREVVADRARCAVWLSLGGGWRLAERLKPPVPDFALGARARPGRVHSSINDRMGKSVGSRNLSDGALTKPQGSHSNHIVCDPLTPGGSIGPRSLDGASLHGRGFFCCCRGLSRRSERSLGLGC